VQVNAERDARSFLVEWWVVGFAGLTKPNYKPTMGGRCIGTRNIVRGFVRAYPPIPTLSLERLDVRVEDGNVILPGFRDPYL
jgi:hypothetical protein